MMTSRLTSLLPSAMLAALTVLPAASAFAMAPGKEPLAQLDATIATTQHADGKAEGVAVSYTYKPAAATAAPLTLELDTLEPALERSTDTVTDLAVSDERGAVPVGAAIRRKDGASTYQAWTTMRPVSGAVHVTYRMAVAPGKVAKRGPQFDLQAAGGG